MRFYLANAVVCVLLYVSCVETSSLVDELRAAAGLRCNGIDNGCCTKEKPCKENDGDCDNSNQCEGDLVCGSNNCVWGDGDDCCMPGPCKGIDNGCCTKEKPCKENDGDCDNDNHCEGDLVCGSNNCVWGDGDGCCMPDPGSSCVDKNADCGFWASSGECTKNPGYMNKSCAKSCGKCGGTGGSSCVDKNPSCGSWKSSGECTKNPGYMDKNCAKSCGKCGGTGDKENILNAITSIIANPPSTRDTTSKRSKLLQGLANTIKDVGTDVITKQKELYEDVFKDLFLKIVANPELEDYFPNYSSAFQKIILPTAIQNEDPNSPLLKSKLKTKFPKAVEDSAELEDKEVTINGTYVNKCIFKECFGGKWISTDLYAKQGQLVTVTIPEDVVGKFAIRIGSHTDEVLSKNKKKWLKGKEFARPYCIVQYYGKGMIKQETRLLSPYGGLIYIDIRAPIDLGTFTLKFENVITSPRFKQGETTKEEWSKMLASKSAMVELDVPGVIVTIPRYYVDKKSLNMEHLSNEYTKIMKAIFKMAGYEMPRPHRYVYDVAISAFGAHSGYPIVDASFWSEIQQLANGDENNVYDTIWAITHEIGHNLQHSMWTPSGLGETSNDIFSQYANEVALNSNPKKFPNLKYAVEFKEKGKKFSSLVAKGKQNILNMVKQECGWETYRKFFKYYNEEIPESEIPNTNEKRYSKMAQVLSEKCNKNLIPFFKWWKWPVTTETEEATKNLPPWDGIIDALNSVDKSDVLRRCDGTDDGCCTAENPCEENDGDCDNHDDCAGDLVCGKDNCFWGDGDDCCKAATGSGSSAGCKKESDVDYYSFVLGSKITSGEKECAEFCSSDKRCEVWSLRESDGLCWIKNGNPYRIPRAGFLSGTKQCGAAD